MFVNSIGTKSACFNVSIMWIHSVSFHISEGHATNWDFGKDRLSVNTD